MLLPLLAGKISSGKDLSLIHILFNDTTDGFEISRRDLELRGPGEFLGARQSGAALLRFADFETDGFLVEKAMAMADKWIREKDPRAEKHAARWYQSKEKYLEA